MKDPRSFERLVTQGNLKTQEESSILVHGHLASLSFPFAQLTTSHLEKTGFSFELRIGTLSQVHEIAAVSG
jgi:hypothetical protein